MRPKKQFYEVVLWNAIASYNLLKKQVAGQSRTKTDLKMPLQKMRMQLNVAHLYIQRVHFDEK